MTRQVVEECNLSIGRVLDLNDLKMIRAESYPEYQIKVISTPNGYGPIAQVPKKKATAMKEIHLLYDKEHFDLISTLSGFHLTNYHCSACEETCSNEERHQCGGTC